MSMEYELRASDADRHAVVADLERHAAAGRLSLDEFTERVDRVLAARTRGELVLLVRDLPVEPAEPVKPAQQPDNSRHLLFAFLFALLALVIIGGAVAAFR